MQKKEGALKQADEQFQCVVHELSTDPSLVNLKRTLVRAPQIVKQKINIGVQIAKDEGFESLYQTFVKTAEDLQVLESELARYHTQIKTFILQSTNLCDKFSAIFNPNLESKTTATASGEHERDTPIEEGYQRYSVSVKLGNKLSEIRFKTYPSLSLLIDNVKEPISMVVGLTKNIKLSIKERDFAVLDINKYMNSVENLKSRVQGSSFTLKQQQNLIRYEKSLELAKLRYDQINDTFKKELPQFVKLVQQFIHPLSVVLYYIQLTVHYDLLGINEVNDPLFKSRTKHQNVISQSYFEDVVDKYIKAHKKVKDQIESLTITKSKEEIDLRKLSISPKSETSSEKSYTQTSVRTEYQFCTAKFGFEAEQPGDLSFNKGDKIRILDQNNNKEWWKGELNGRVGIFPRNYMESI